MTEFDPDWTVAPAEILREWMTDNRATLTGMARKAASDGSCEVLSAAFLIREILGRRELSARHAATLERATGIPEHAWTALEKRYRDDLAAGRTDFDAPKGETE
jgi:plasmid maintenance system antidote protein VapI